MNKIFTIICYKQVNIDVPGVLNTTTSIKYSYYNHQLYVFESNGYATLYQVNFNHNEDETPTVTTSTQAKPDPTRNPVKTSTKLG